MNHLLRFSAHVTPLRPHVLVVQVGVNDLKTIALFPGRKAEIIATTKENIWRIVEQGTGLNTQVILTTIFPAGEFPLERRKNPYTRWACEFKLLCG